MKIEAQRVALAKAVGFRWQPWGKSDVWLFYPESGWVPQGWYPPREKHFVLPCKGRPIDEVVGELLAQIPFDTDLNAMHEAERVCLNKENLDEWWDRLAEVVNAGLPMRSWAATYANARATAAQRAEALLRALLLWEESA